MGWNQELITHAEIEPFIGILELQSGTATHQGQPLVFSLVVPEPFGAGSRARLDPHQPPIRTLAKHPLLLLSRI